MAASSSVDYGYLRQIVSGHSQNVLDASQDYLFDTRLARLLRNQGLNCIEELVQHLRRHRDPLLERAIAEAMTINETSFFRDTQPFELLRTALLPKLIESRRMARTLRFWSAGCSTGQEALSLAMLLHEHFPQLPTWNVRIDGTDISGEVVEQARAGRYHRIEMNRGLPARLLVRYFTRDGEEWVAKPDIRTMCHFQQANLCAPLCFSKPFDVIFLRNVMLYMSAETRRALLAGVHPLLAPDGLLFLGSTEQPADASLWTAVVAGGTCYYRPKNKRS